MVSQYWPIPRPQRVLSWADDRGFLKRAQNTEDMTDRINWANARALAKGYDCVHIPSLESGTDIRFNAPITFPVGLSVSRARKTVLRCMATTDEPHIIVGQEGTWNPYVSIDLKAIRNVATNWTPLNDIGILCHNLAHFHLFIGGCEFFTNNLELRGSHLDGFNFGTVKLGGIFHDARFHVTLNKIDSNGVMNELYFDCSEAIFATSSGKRASVGPSAGYPVGVRYMGDNAHPFNAHVWHKPAMEITTLFGTPWEDHAPFQFEAQASDIQIRDARLETLLKHFMKIKSTGVTAVTVGIGYARDSAWKPHEMIIDETNQYNGHKVLLGRRAAEHSPGVWESDNFGEAGHQYSTDGKVHVPGFFFHHAAGTRNLQSLATGHTFGTDHISLAASSSEGPCILVDTERTKLLTVMPLVVGGDGSFLRMNFIGWGADLTTRYTSGVITANRVGDQITSYTVGHGGRYIVAPTIIVSGGGGTGAAGTPVLTAGVITSVTVDDVGSGYTGTPAVTIVETGTHWIKGGTLKADTNFGGSYQGQTNSDNARALQIKDEVKWLQIIPWQQGSTACRLKGLHLASGDGGPVIVRNWFSGYTRGERWVNAAPTLPWKGNYNANTLFLNAVPTAAGQPWAYRYLNALDGFEALNP